jgi:hypothetical protein
MKQTIVITTVFPPSEAIKQFGKRSDCDLIVVGDRKTPLDWAHPHVTYLSFAAQAALPFAIAESVPADHYSRKMLGYLEAMRCGADIIVDTDDDNIPKDRWSFPSFDDSYETVDGIEGFVNVYQLFSSKKIWPRGLPLRLIKTDFALHGAITRQRSRIGVWQGLADEDPDVDAIYRLTDDSPTYFKERAPVALAPRVLSPFNSQNTQFRRECFPLLYLPAFVTFRFTDILRGLVAQPIMWAAGYQLGFIDATVTQKRNPHNYMRDFGSEIPMYMHCEDVIELVEGAIGSGRTISQNLHCAYEALLSRGIVTSPEMVTLSAWLRDIERYA